MDLVGSYLSNTNAFCALSWVSDSDQLRDPLEVRTTASTMDEGGVHRGECPQLVSGVMLGGAFGLEAWSLESCIVSGNGSGN